MKHHKIIIAIALIISICIFPSCKQHDVSQTEGTTEASLQETSKYPVYMFPSASLDSDSKRIFADKEFMMSEENGAIWIDENEPKTKMFEFNGEKYNLIYLDSFSSIYTDSHFSRYVWEKSEEKDLTGFIFYKGTDIIYSAVVGIGFSIENASEIEMKNLAIELIQKYSNWNSKNYEYRIRTYYHEIHENWSAGRNVDRFISDSETQDVYMYNLRFTEPCEGGHTFNYSNITFQSDGDILITCFYEDYGNTFTDLSSKVAFKDIFDSVSAFVKNHCTVNDKKGLTLERLSDDIIFYKKGGKVYAQVSAYVENADKSLHEPIEVSVEIGVLDQ